jgi:HEAT repeat protein
MPNGTKDILVDEAASYFPSSRSNAMTKEKWIAVLTDDCALAAARHQAIEEMRAALQGEDSNSRSRVLATMCHVGMEAIELRDDLVRLWQSPPQDCPLRQLVPALGRIREVSTLAELLRDVERAHSLRRSAADALRDLGSGAAAAAPALVETLRDNDKRYGAIHALTSIGEAAIPALIAGLSDESELLRSRALRTLGFIGSTARNALPSIVSALEDPAAKVRIQAIFALSCLAPLPETAFLGVVRSLEDQDESVRSAAISALDKLGPDAAAATPALILALEKGNADERVDILNSLAAIGPGASTAAPALKKLLGDDDGKVRVAAAMAMWRISGDSITTIEILTAAVNASDYEVGRAALRALGQMGDVAVAAVPAIVAALADVDADVRTEAVRATGNFRSARDVIGPALLPLLEDKDGDTRWATIQSLLRLGIIDSQIGESICHAMKHGAWEGGSTSGDHGRCEEALDLIRVLGPKAASYVPTLEHLRDRYPGVRVKAIFALAQVQADIASAIPQLIAILDDTAPPCPCQTAADCLGEIGPAARDAVPHLVRMARYGPNFYNRRAARDALLWIDPIKGGAIQENFS